MTKKRNAAYFVALAERFMQRSYAEPGPLGQWKFYRLAQRAEERVKRLAPPVGVERARVLLEYGAAATHVEIAYFLRVLDGMPANTQFRDAVRKIASGVL